jgi:hypothetical protein
MLQMSTPYGYIFDNGEGFLPITATFIDGGGEVSSGITYKWYKFDVSTATYTEVKQTADSYMAGKIQSNQIVPDTSIAANASINSKILIVYGTEVDSYASFKCEATYGGNPYVGYASLEDKTDPIQVAIISTVGTQIVNGTGVGCFYARVTKNDGQGTELDPLPTGVSFVTEKPSTLVNNAYYYLLDTTNKTATLYKASSTSTWAVDTAYAAANYHGTYNWTYRDFNNEVITQGTPASTGRVVYVDAELINKKIIIDVEVII